MVGGEISWPNPPLCGTASDDEAVARMHGVQFPKGYQAPMLQTEDEADERASAILRHLQMESVRGMVVIPHDCRLELYDLVMVQDTR